jgi:hypothetical protein
MKYDGATSNSCRGCFCIKADKNNTNSSIFRRVLGYSYFITIFTLLVILFSQEISFRQEFFIYEIHQKNTSFYCSYRNNVCV